MFNQIATVEHDEVGSEVILSFTKISRWGRVPPKISKIMFEYLLHEPRTVIREKLELFLEMLEDVKF